MSMAANTQVVKDIVIVGGGTAGWLTATILASRLKKQYSKGVNIRLVEAPGIPIVGLGEGTWPSLRTTLRGAGIKEADFLKYCSASFKQASKFVGWRTGDDDDFYYHPFDLPETNEGENLAGSWLDGKKEESFSMMCCVQETICEQHLSPKLKTSRGYAGVTNYGYHLDAGKFSEFLREHCTKNMGVDLTLDRVVSINSDENGNISSVKTEDSGPLTADLFIDCTGFRSLLLGEHLGVGFVDKSDVFPINSAIAVRVPHDPDAPVKSPTISTAQEAGWIWDIGLSHRRGVGYVYSDNHISHENAYNQLQTYLGLDDEVMANLTTKRLPIRPGYRNKFWQKNCVAIGLSAGFLEPLEATAIMLIETSANMIVDVLLSNEATFERNAERFNARLHYRWNCIIDFLKLHYVLSERPESFWRAAASEKTMSDRLKNDLELWKVTIPLNDDFQHTDNVFPAASYQYVLYGMGRYSQVKLEKDLVEKTSSFRKAFEDIERQAMYLSSKLVTNRDILDLIKG